MGNHNSGRKSRYSELRINELGKLSINWAIDNWPKLQKAEKLKITLALAPKYIQSDDESKTQTIIINVINTKSDNGGHPDSGVSGDRASMAESS